MTVYIGHASGDERGKASGGQAGDQTGKEVCRRTWYLNSKGWRVFRAKDPAIAKLIAAGMRKAFENDRIGYDQGQRDTLYSLAAKVDFDCSRVTTACETDCSALVRVCCAYAGVKMQNFNTASEPARLMATGKFEEKTGSKYTESSDYLCEGDILVTKVKGHTAVVLSDGPKAERQTAPDPADKTGKVVKIIGNAVYIRNSDSTKGGILSVAHAGERYPFLGTAPSGWHKIQAKKGIGYITNKTKYTRLEDE